MKNNFLVCMLTLVSMVVGSNYANAFQDPRFIGCNSGLDDSVGIDISEYGINTYTVIQIRPTAQYFYQPEMTAYGAKCAIDASTYREAIVNGGHAKGFLYRCGSKPTAIRVKLNTPSSTNRYGGWYQCKLFNM